jgi:hypothetical protein
MKNDKLQEIEEQCWIDTTPIRSYLNREKFAQLIIQECVGICDKVEDEYLTKRSSVNSDIAHGADLCSYKITKHFGVK